MNRLFLNGGSRGGIHEMLVNKLQSTGPGASRPGKTSWVDGDGKNFMAKIGEALKNDGCVKSVFYSFDRTTVPGIVPVNNGGPEDIGIIDATNINDVNIAERMGLQAAFDFVRTARKYRFPGLEQRSLVRTGQDLGVRETRRMEGEYTMAPEDAQKGREFPDAVALRYGTIDPGGLREGKNHHGSVKNGHQYPYRCMLPKEVDPLLVAGRCASLTRLGLAACKSMGNMMAIGQAAGVAAALSAKEGVLPRHIDVKKIQERLINMKLML
jgi:hypothetical protein